MVKNKMTLNVLANITKKVSGKNVSNSMNKALIVFTGSNIELNERIDELKELRNGDVGLSLAFSFMAERILDMDYITNSLNPIVVYKENDVFQLEDLVKEYDYIIGPNITTNTLSKVSLGMVDSFISNIIWTYLYKEKPVYLDFSSIKNYLGSPSNNKAINNVIDSHIKTLKDMGVIELEPRMYLKKIANVKDFNNRKEKIKVNSDFKKVITENDLNDIQKGESLILPKGTIITPLAKDKVNQLGIKLKIEK